MRCEVCGRRIRGKPNRVIIEGAKMTVCKRCARLGTPYHEPPKPKVTPKGTVAKRTPLIRKTSIKASTPKIDNSLELIDDYSVKVRQAREKLGLTHEDLGKKIGEKVSVLKKVETGKMVPDNVLARKLEHALQIKLLVPAQSLEPKATKPIVAHKPQKGLTLGDIAQIKVKEEKLEGSE